MGSKRVTVPKEETPSEQFWKKSLWPMPQPEMTPRPVSTTRFFSAFSCVEVNVRVAVVDGDRSVNALAVETPMTMRLDVANFMLSWFIRCSLMMID